MEDIQPVTQLAPMLRLPQLAPEQVAVERARQSTLLTYWTVREQDVAPSTIPDEMRTPPIAPDFPDCSEAPATPIPETLKMPAQATSAQDALE
ncbi:MAG: hypothetical protein H0W02_08250 [Ktedonobacteraceae bacterium]|nr:hypothetical protein [Ktedonobacteraceae bacterium]